MNSLLELDIPTPDAYIELAGVQAVNVCRQKAVQHRGQHSFEHGNVALFLFRSVSLLFHAL